MGGVVLVFKLALLPIIAVFWATSFYDTVAHKKKSVLRALIQIGIPIIVGALIPLATVFVYFAWHDELKILYWTFIEFPSRVINSPHARIGNKIDVLAHSLQWFIYRFTPVMALGTIGGYVALRNRRDLFTLNLVLWTILGFAVILMQRFSWWTYHFLLVFVPLGILSAQGLDAIAGHTKPLFKDLKGRTAAFLSVILLFSPVIGPLPIRAFLLTRAGFVLNREKIFQYQSRVYPAYKMNKAETAFLSNPASLPGDIYVLGDPLYYLLSGRRQAIAQSGWGFKEHIPELWTKLIEQLGAALPSYIFIKKNKLDDVRNFSPETFGLINKNYSVWRTSDAGVWYMRRGRERAIGTDKN
jgi:hypothetical protein